jgi:hypothetical protein
MVVSDRSKLDPRLEQQTAMDTRERILKKLRDIENYLKDTRNDEALRGCGLIRKALAKKTEYEDLTSTKDDVAGDHLGAPSKALTERDYSMYDAADDNEILAMLMHGNGVGDLGFEEVADEEQVRMTDKLAAT